MRSIYFLLIFIFLLSCQVSKKDTGSNSEKKEEALFTVNSSPVYPEEFMYAFNKSIKNKGDSESIDDYLELYINFKLKVEAAKQQGLDTLESYISELDGYLKDIKKPYLITEKVNEALLTETYNRLQKEVNASHILIRVENDASPTDTLKAYNEILKIKSLFESGSKFNELAEKYSEDPSAKQNQGNLGWFTAFQMVYPFESAAYNTPEGEISEIIRTQFGYHLIYVNEIRETSGRIKIAHILLRFPPGANQSDSIAVKKQIYAIHNELIEGEPWFSLAAKYSEDLNTKDNGGSLPWFVTGGLPESIETAAFQLSQPGQISSPVKSQFGWHILKLEDKRGMGSLESMRESLSRRIQRDQRSDLKTSEVINKLKLQNNFQENEAVYLKLRNIKPFKKESVEQELKDKILFTIGEKPFLVKDFLSAYTVSTPIKIAIANFEKEMILSYEDSHLADKYPEYRLLAAEYRDGLLLFEVMSKQVWNKVGSDSIGMHAFYEAHKANYKSQEQIRADIFQLKLDSSTINILNNPIHDSLYALGERIKLKDFNQDYLQAISRIEITLFLEPILPVGTSLDSILSKIQPILSKNDRLLILDPIYSEENEIYLQLCKAADKYLKDYYPAITDIESGVYETRNVLVQNSTANKGVILTQEGNNQVKMINILEVIQPEQQNFEAAKSELISDYQNHLENEWVKQLKRQNIVNINQKVLKTVKEKLEK